MVTLIPLLESLLKRKAAADCMIQDALHRFKAAKRIARFCSIRYYCGAKEKQQQIIVDETKSSGAHKNKINIPSQSKRKNKTTDGWEHWLFQSFYSPSLKVRQIVARLFYHHFILSLQQQKQQNNTSSSQATTATTTTSAPNSAAATTKDEKDPLPVGHSEDRRCIIQALMALLNGHEPHPGDVQIFSVLIPLLLLHNNNKHVTSTEAGNHPASGAPKKETTKSAKDTTTKTTAQEPETSKNSNKNKPHATNCTGSKGTVKKETNSTVETPKIADSQITNTRVVPVTRETLQWMARSLLKWALCLIPMRHSTATLNNMENVQGRLLLYLDFLYQVILPKHAVYHSLWDKQRQRERRRLTLDSKSHATGISAMPLARTSTMNSVDSTSLASPPATKPITTTTNTRLQRKSAAPDLSPLACMLVTHSILSNYPPTKIHGMDEYLTLLGQIIDPKNGPSHAAAAVRGAQAQKEQQKQQQQQKAKSPMTVRRRQRRRQGEQQRQQQQDGEESKQTSNENNNKTMSSRQRAVRSLLLSHRQSSTVAALMAHALSVNSSRESDHQRQNEDEDDDEMHVDDDIVMEEHDEDEDEDEEEETHLFIPAGSRGRGHILHPVAGEDDDDDDDDDDDEDDDDDDEADRAQQNQVEGYQVPNNNRHHEEAEDGEEDEDNSDSNHNGDEDTRVHDEEEDGEENAEEEEEGDDEDEENDEDGDDSEDEGDDEHEIILRNPEVHEEEDEIVDVVRRFEERLMDINERETNTTATANIPVKAPSNESSSQPAPNDGNRREVYICACLEVLSANHLGNSTNIISASSPHFLLDVKTEDVLLQSLCNIIKPPKKAVNLKIFMRRAPSQEEFFRGSLNRNPIKLSHLTKAMASSSRGAPSSTTGMGGSTEPTVRDLRQYIADQLQMSETAELLELLCANKILNLDLKIRVVNQVLWKNHLIENNSTVFPSSLLGSSSGVPSFFSTSSGLSMVFSTGLGEREISASGRNSISAETPASSLPPVVITYRLIGVDGEATEDVVETLADPEAPDATKSAEEQEKMLEQEYGITRLLTEGRGIQALMRSIKRNIGDSIRRVRRDDILFRNRGIGKRSEMNAALAKLQKAQPCPGLTLLLHCSKMPSNRKKLLDARAPTILLRLLLDVLNAIDKSCPSESDENSAAIVSNPTAELLEQLIETLASEISTDNTQEDEMEQDQSGSTLPLLLSSLKSIYLGPPLRKVIAKLLPFLTYGQISLSKELAENFVQFINLNKLCEFEGTDSQPKTRSFAIMDTFVQAAIQLPANNVCNSLRTELLACGFVAKLVEFIMLDMPDQPTPWTSALWPKSAVTTKQQDREILRNKLTEAWKRYFKRTGIKTAFDVLVGLCRRHGTIQLFIMDFQDERFIKSCHWIESTSDHKASDILLNGIGLIAETLLDEVKEGNPVVSKRIGAIRKATRARKKQIAEERRAKALVGISSFAPLANSLEQSADGGDRRDRGRRRNRDEISSSSPSLVPVLDASNPNPESRGESGTTGGPKKRRKIATKETDPTPAWLAELDALEDDEGITCVVCQEGRTLQPSELLGLYTYIKKVSMAPNKHGVRTAVDGTVLLLSLPSSLPTSLIGTKVESNLFQDAKDIGNVLRSSGNKSASSSRRPVQFTTTVSAGNAIHCACHSKARAADRNHPKAPKSEWEGASLRNSRVSCNAILPLVSSRSSKVPLVAVDMALTEYQTVVSNLMGSRPKSMLWAVLHDIRLLMLRIAHAEALNADCGGGSLSSNASLLFFELSLADMFTNDAAVDSPETAKHARFLSGGLLSAVKIITAGDYEDTKESTHKTLVRAIADAAPMAALTCILYHNHLDDSKDKDEDDDEGGDKGEKTRTKKISAEIPHPQRRWEVYKREFLTALVMWAGRRHSLGIHDSGCLSNRSGSRSRAAHALSSAADWGNNAAAASSAENADAGSARRKGAAASIAGTASATSLLLGTKRGLPKIEEYAKALRPMLLLYCMFDTLSAVYIPHMTDKNVEESSAYVVKRVNECLKAKSLAELLRKAKISIDHDLIMEDLQRGLSST